MGLDWDLRLVVLVNSLAGHLPWLDEAMRSLGRPVYFYLPGAAALSYWIWKKRGQALMRAALLGLLIAAVDFISFELKSAVARPRPCQVSTEVKKVVGCGRAFSFPSNHAANTAAAAVFLQAIYPATGWVAWPLVVLIGFSRIYVGAHYVSDVFGGWLLGAGFALSIVRFLPKSVNVFAASARIDK
jgi:undecaprenyl-diphosphatase